MEDEQRFQWKWFDWLAWALFACLGVATIVRHGDWLAGAVLMVAFPLLRGLAASNTKAHRNW